jgi:hypothetical protein
VAPDLQRAQQIHQQQFGPVAVPAAAAAAAVAVLIGIHFSVVQAVGHMQWDLVKMQQGLVLQYFV